MERAIEAVDVIARTPEGGTADCYQRYDFVVGQARLTSDAVVAMAAG